MATIEDWRAFLQKWSDEWLATEAKFPPAVRRNRWLGYKPATDKQIEQLEKRLGYRLPPSYRAFLLTSNGWRTTSPFISQLRSSQKVEWLEVEDAAMLDGWCEDYESLDGLQSEEYFSYDGRPLFDNQHMKQCLKIADPVPGDTAIYLLNPEVVTEDGEWEAWFFAHWIPGAQRYPSFAHLMRAQYDSFRSTELGDKTLDEQGPFAGVYAPDSPRCSAKRIGPGKPRAKRLTVFELIQKLEDPSPKERMKAANKLVWEFKPHDPENEHPEWVEQLTRILHSDRETEVRCMAACMLGSYGDRSAVPPLVAALEDDAVSGSVISALGYLSLWIKDSAIADGLCHFLSRPQNTYSIENALHILEDFGDPRLADIARRLLDSVIDDDLRFSAALALVASSNTAVDELIAKLPHDDPEIRAIAAVALREAGDRRAVEPLRAMLADPDPIVRVQATWSLQFFGEDIQVDPVDQDKAHAQRIAKLDAKRNP